MHVYDPVVDQWTSLPGPSEDIGGAVYATVNGLGYTFRQTGAGGVRVYNPANNQWNTFTAPAGFYYASSFLINSNVYMGLGYGSGNKFWKYSTLSNTWNQISDFPGGLRVQAISFAIGTSGFVGGADFWEYDSVKGTWARQADIPLGVNEVNSFSYLGKGYVTSNSALGKFELWSYDPNK